MAKKKESKKSVDFITDIIHEVRDGVLVDVYMSGDKEIKVEVSKEQ